MSEPVINLIAEASEELGVPYEVALAVAQHESNLDPYARGAAGEVGVFQIIPKWHAVNARRLGFDINTVAGNVYYGIHLLGSMIEHEQGNLVNALRRYNGGPMYKNKPDTRAYAAGVVDKISKLQHGFSPIRHHSISSGFGRRVGPDTGVEEDHGGIDLSAPQGTPVFSATSGKVSSVKHLKSSYGTHIRIKGFDGREYIYAHLSGERVEVGQTIRAGQRIGAVGSTGRATGPHLHFEVRENGAPIDPTAWVKGQPPSATPDDPIGDPMQEKQTFAEMLALAFQTDIQTALGATDGLLSAMGLGAPGTEQLVDVGVESELTPGLTSDVQNVGPEVGEFGPDIEDETGLAPFMAAVAPMLGADDEGELI